MTHNYGWTPDRKDLRDRIFAAPLAAPAPPVVDLTAHCPPVKDQGSLGSCTANGIAGILEFDQLAQGEPHLPLSRLWIYYQERLREHSVGSDAGAAIRDGIKVATSLGACVETDWPYDIATFRGPPPAACKPDARLHKAIQYQSVPNHPASLETALAAGFPVVFGFSVYSSFESAAVATTGIVPMPSPGESMLGGHCVFMCGYDRAAQRFLCQNSWGADWGLAGRFTLPYAYVAKLASDFWCVEHISA